MRALHVVMLLLIGSAVAIADEPKTKKEDSKKEDDKPVSFWMEKKLEYTQGILRGLATGELDDVAEKGEQMRLLSKVEGWVRNRRPGYRAQFQAFELANGEIVRNAKSDNLEGATIAFQQLTITCVSCHKILRDTN